MGRKIKTLLEALKCGTKGTTERIDKILKEEGAISAQEMMSLCINCQAIRDLSNTIFSEWKKRRQSQLKDEKQ